MKAKLLFIGLTVISFYSTAQKEVAPVVTPIIAYGEPITLEAAKKIANAAHAFAVSKQWPVVIVIVDTGGNLVLLEKFDNTQIGSIDVAIGKAKTANNFKRSTKTFEDGITAGGAGLRVLNVAGILPVEGGEPILSNGKIIGAIGVSGMKPGEDGEVVKAGLAAFK